LKIFRILKIQRNHMEEKAIIIFFIVVSFSVDSSAKRCNQYYSRARSKREARRHKLCKCVFPVRPLDRVPSIAFHDTDSFVIVSRWPQLRERGVARGFDFMKTYSRARSRAPTCKRACTSARNNTSACTHIHCTQGIAISHCRWRRYGTSYWLVWSWVTPRPTLTLSYYLACEKALVPRLPRIQ